MINIHIAEKNDIKKVFALRSEVFVDEQNVPMEIELDEEDAHAVHIIAEEDGVTVGCARLIPSENEGHIGRLAVKKVFRGRGIGADICRFITDHCLAEGHTYIWLNSQLHAVGFYEKLGFKTDGKIFTEAGIEHIKMVYEKRLEEKEK